MANLKGILNAAGDGPLTFGQRLAGDPRIARVIEGNLPALSQIDPQLAARLQQRDPEAIFAAYQMIAGADGTLAAPRQMELPLSDDPVEAIRALIPFGSRGPGVTMGGPSGSGVPVGEPSGPGVLQFAPPSTSRMELAIPPRPEPRRTIPRLGTTAWTRGSGLGPTGIIPHPSMGGPRDLIAVPPPGPMGLRDAAALAIAGGAAGAGGLLVGERIGQEFMRDDGLAEPSVQAGEEPDMPMTQDESVDLQSGNTADLAAETSPPPKVVSLAPEEQAFVDSFKEGYAKREARRAAAQDRAWRRPIDEGHVPLGDATQDEINRAHDRENNMVRMGVPRDQARTRAYDQMSQEVVRRARARAEAFLRANPNF